MIVIVVTEEMKVSFDDSYEDVVGLPVNES
jgi:hypothetical protein